MVIASQNAVTISKFLRLVESRLLCSNKPAFRRKLHFSWFYIKGVELDSEISMSHARAIATSN